VGSGECPVRNLSCAGTSCFRARGRADKEKTTVRIGRGRFLPLAKQKETSRQSPWEYGYSSATSC